MYLQKYVTPEDKTIALLLFLKHKNICEIIQTLLNMKLSEYESICRQYDE